MTTPLRALASAIKSALDAATRALASANIADQSAKAANKSAVDALGAVDTARVHSSNASDAEGVAVAQAAIATTQANAATTQAGSALAWANASQTSANASQTSRLASEAARDSVNTTGKVFADTASGIAGTTNGQTFAVLDTGLQFWNVYKNNAGAAQIVASTYTKAYIDTVGTFGDVYFQGKRALFARIGSGSVVGDFIAEDGRHYAKYAIRGVNGVQVAQAADAFFELSVGAVDTLTFTGGGSLGGVTDYYYAGKRVIRARVDTNSRASMVETDDGSVYIPKLASLSGGNGVQVTQTPTGQQLSLGAVDTLAFTDGVTLGGLTDYYYAGKRVIRAWADPTSHASMVETEDGTVYIPKLVSPALDLAGGSAPLESAQHVFDVASANGLQQVFRTGKTSGVRVQATSAGNNSVPRLSVDASKVIYSTDRNGVREGYYQLVGGGKHGGAIEHPVTPRKTIMALGDSLTAADYAGTVAASVGTTLLIPSADPRCGIGSQTSTQIAARFGAIDVTCSFLGNAMGSGPTAITALSVQMLSRASDVNGTIRTLRASVLGVVGVLTSMQSPTPVSNALSFSGAYYFYTFTPDAGQTLPGAVPPGTPLVIDPETRQDSVLLVWMGRNDVGGAAGWQNVLKTNIAAVFAAYKPLVRNIALVSVTNSTAEPTGTQNHDDIVALNADLAALYPDSFVDVRTAYNTGTSNDTPNPAYTADGLHYNDSPGKAVIAAPVTAFLKSKGWF